MIAAVITSDGKILYSPLNQVGELEASDIEPQSVSVGTEFLPLEDEPTPSPGMPVVGLSADRRAWIERLGNTYIGFVDPFSHLTNIDPDAVEVAEWFKDAHISRIECPPNDFSDGGQYKEFFELQLTFERDSRLYLGVAAETQPDGLRAWRWKGLVYNPRVPVRVPLKMPGTHIRLRLVMVSFNGGRAMLKDMRIGFNRARRT